MLTDGEWAAVEPLLEACRPAAASTSGAWAHDR